MMKAKKGLKTLIFTLILTVILMIAASCVTPQFELKFEVDGDIIYKINTGGQEGIKLPDNPQKDGYIFDGWFWDKDEWKKPFTANSLLDAPLSSDMTVYAKWKNEITSITVSFNSNGGSNVESITIEKGKSIILSESPTKEGYLFDGWYTDESLTTNSKVTATTTFDTNTLLNAKWIAHTHDYTLTNVAATCEEDGYTIHTCICGDTYKDNIVSKLGHNLENDFTIDLEPTCTANGSKSKHCTNCDEIEEITVINALGHNGGTATCTEKAICDRCNLEYGEMLKHNFESSFTIDLEPTCTVNGSQSKHCTNCYEKEEITVINALGHNGGTATCTEKAICDRCNIEYGETAEHIFQSDFTIDLEPTCTENGSKSKHCTNCDEIEEITVIDALGHNGGIATCTEKAICDRCNLEYGEITEHTFESNFTMDLEPTCTENGSKSKHCSNCAEKEEITVINALGHIGGTATCTEKAICDRCNLEYGDLGHYFNGGICIVCEAEQTQGLSYEKITGGYEVSGLGTVKDNNIFIPAKHNGQPVTSIGFEAFRGCYSLTNITIPDSVTKIGEGAFFDTGIWNNAENDGVVYVDKWAVGYKGTITTITLRSDTVGIGPKAFMECNSLKSITIPSSVTTIGDYAFSWCRKLTSINIPNNVTNIGNYAFYENNSLTNITLPQGVTNIGGGAFAYCNRLTSIALPEGVTSIGNYTFSGCSSLTSISLPSSLTNIGNGAFSNCNSLTNITIPQGVKSIGSYSFFGCQNKTNIIIPTSVTSIGDNAFYNSGIWNNAENNGAWVVGNKGTITTLTLNNDIVGICSNAFINCISLTSIIIPDSVKSIGANAFSKCSCLIIFAQAESKPSGWNNDWNPDNRPVVWGLTEVKETYTVTFNSNGGTTVSDIFKEEGGQIVSAPTTTKEDYTFDGWYDGETKVVFPYTVVENKTLTAKWLIHNHSYVYSEAVVPNCTTEGYDKYLCECGEIEKKDIVSSLGHIGGTANCTEKAVCDRCQLEYGDALGHKFIQGFCKVCHLEQIEETLGLAFKEIIGGYEVSGIGTVTDNIIIIPSKHNGLPVISIGTNAFSNCRSIIKITIPSSVISIGAESFSYCSSLTIYAVVTSKPNGWDNTWNNNRPVIWNCKANDKDKDGYSYIIEENITYRIKDEITTVFAAPFNIKTANIKTNITYKEKSYTITSIDFSVFSGCSSLVSITFAEGSQLKSIGSSSFRDCSSLTSITIPNSVTSIGSEAFYGCDSLISITLPFVGGTKEATSNSHFGYIFGASSYSSNSDYIPQSLKTVIISGGTSVSSFAFYKCRNLKNITLSDSITSIGSSAFEECLGLISIYLPYSITSIDNNTFKDCANLKSIIIPKTVKIISDYAFSWCSSLISITLPDSLTHLGYSAFKGCINLENITIPKEVVSIGASVFAWCSSLMNITIPSRVTSIGDSAFDACSNLTIYAEATSKPSGWQYNWNINNRPVIWNCNSNDKDNEGNLFIIEENITYKLKNGEATVYSAPGNITSANIKTTINYKDAAYVVTSIGDNAFSWCSNLTSISIPVGVTSIGASAFYGCRNLTRISIPSSMTSIGERAFYLCDSLTSIIIPKNVKIINSETFSGCTSLTSITFEKESELTHINSSAFYNCNNLSSIEIPEGVTSIGDSSFWGCSKLTSLTFAEGSQLTNIGSSAFYECSRLKNFTLPSNVTSIGDSAFRGCSSLENIRVESGNSKYVSNGNCLIEIARKTIILGGKNSIIPVDGSVTSIGSYAFYNCSGLISITIPTSVTSIGSYAFQGCNNLTIYAEAESKPSGWDSNWNSSNRPVKWNYKP